VSPRLIVPAAFLLLACAPGGPPAGEEEGHGAGEPERVHVAPADARAWGVEVGTPTRTTTAAEFVLPGTLGTNDNRTARIASLVPGQIAAVHVDLGMGVHAGQALATLNAPEFARAQTAYLQALTQSELARRDSERARVLRESRALEEREFLRRQSVYEEQLANLRAAEGVLRALGVSDEGMSLLAAGVDAQGASGTAGRVDPLLPIRTPLGGVVLERSAVLGEPVEPGRTLFTVSDLSVLWAWLDAYEHQIPHLDPSADVVVRSALLPGRDFPGRITFIADQVDPQLRTVRVRVEVPNPGGALKPNMYVQGFLRVRTPGVERIVVPAEAVQLHEGHSVVFVERAPESGEEHRVFEVREVVPGDVLTEGQVILDGLNGSEAVALRGAFVLKAELTKSAGGQAHVH
jgi:cobalt-zinc-cadmium efflux system membrane fusion protein